MHGSAMLVHTLMQHDLVDRYRLLIYPLVLGKGKRLFDERTKVTLTRVDAAESGRHRKEIVFDRIGQRSDIVLIELPR